MKLAPFIAFGIWVAFGYVASVNAQTPRACDRIQALSFPEVPESPSDTPESVRGSIQAISPDAGSPSDEVPEPQTNRVGTGVRDRNTVFATPGMDTPTRTTGGASRADPPDPPWWPSFPMAVMPDLGDGTSLTLSASPTFFVYLPSGSISALEWSLSDAEGNCLFQLEIPQTNRSGIVSFNLPADAPSLEVDRDYQWKLIYPWRSEEIFEGLIRRVEIDRELLARIEEATPQEKAALYAENELWYEAIATLAELRRANPGNARAAQWKILLESVGLEDLKEVPLLEHLAFGEVREIEEIETSEDTAIEEETSDSENVRPGGFRPPDLGEPSKPPVPGGTRHLQKEKIKSISMPKS